MITKSILLVEDDPFLSDIYSTKLRSSGFDVQVVSDGEDCLTFAAEKNFDLILLDIVLPKMDGWEILREIKKTKGIRSMPVIILSNLSQRAEVEKGLNLGAVKYLIKAHYTPSEVVEEIKKVIG
ncbi:MAG: response regulator [bacterium]|nr:response regulator [bacterium]